MKKKPRKVKEKIISLNMDMNIIVIGVLITIATLTVFRLNLPAGETLARTSAFTLLVMLEFVRLYMIRSEYRTPFFSNAYLLWAIIISFLLQLAVIYTPLSFFFRTVPLTVSEWVIMTTATVAMLAVGVVSAKIIRSVTKTEH